VFLGPKCGRSYPGVGLVVVGAIVIVGLVDLREVTLKKVSRLYSGVSGLDHGVGEKLH
jgi:hypothetical protein